MGKYSVVLYTTLTNTEMQFDPVTYNDLGEIRNLQPEGWSDIVPEFKFYVDSAFCNPIKIKIDNKIVGVGASIAFNNTSWIAHIIVESSFRKRGIGYYIVEELLKNIESNSIKTCSLIATELGQSIYMKAGFRIVTEYSFFKREIPWKDQPISKNTISFKEEYRSQIYELDKKISGENREKLITHHLVHSIVYVENNEVIGYHIPSLKEGLIFADTDDAGLELMKIKYAKINEAALPSDNIAGIEFLKQNGFVKTNKRGTRMIRGRDIDWDPKKIYSRIGGNLG